MLLKEDFKRVRLTKTVHLTFNILLTLILVIGFNILASTHYFRKDLTKNRFYSLSPETLAYIQKLNKPVQIFITIPPESSQPDTSEIFFMVSQLINEYEHASRFNPNAKITVEYIDPYRQMQRARQIATEFGVQKDNSIIIKSEDNYRQITANELFKTKKGSIEEFKGEQVFTSAILNVTGSQKEKIYFTKGHGEMRINDVDPLRGLSEINHLLKTYNIDTAQIDLSQISEIPLDANLIIIASPQTPLLPEEVEQLRRFLLDRNGRLLAFLDPIQPHGLDDLLYEWGILADNRLIIDSHNNSKTHTGDLVLRNFTNHTITNFLEDYQLSVQAGLTRPIRPNIASPLDPRRTVIPLIFSSPTSWAKHSQQIATKIDFDSTKDLQGPLPVATLAQRSVNSQLEINIRGGRMIVFGNSSFIANNRINALGNRMMFQNTVNWAIDLNDLLNIPPKKLKKFQISLSQNDLLCIALGMLTIPGSFACIGLFIFAIRRR